VHNRKASSVLRTLVKREKKVFKLQQKLSNDRVGSCSELKATRPVTETASGAVRAAGDSRQIAGAADVQRLG